jgi:hypothetical protein
MRTEDYLHVMLRAMRQDAAYSSRRHGWLIPMLKARIFYLEQLEELPPEFGSLEDVVEEGIQRGFWELDAGTDVLLMK